MNRRIELRPPSVSCFRTNVPLVLIRYSEGMSRCKLGLNSIGFEETSLV